MQTVQISAANGDKLAAPAHWLGHNLAVHPPVGKDRAFKVSRGHWAITHVESGLMAASLLATKADALKLAKQWDSRFSSINAADARQWPWRKQWNETVARINNPWASSDESDAGSTDTAAELAATAGLAIDQAGGSIRAQWRGRFWPLPTDQQLNAWATDSCCETPDGRTVEPDHPESWLAILRLI